MQDRLEEMVAPLMRQQRLKLVLAESCTGGLISDLITNVPGSSDYYLGGVVTYADTAKRDILGVSMKTLADYGAVSRQTVIEMARGVRKLFSQQGYAIDNLVGISVSGIAGPTGGTVEKPVGTVWIGMSSPKGDWAWEHHWDGTRMENKSDSAEQALKWLWVYLTGDLRSR
jgi:PncC family amidohydrolase